MEIEENVIVSGLNCASTPRTSSKKNVLLFTIIVLYFIIANESILVSSKPTIRYNNSQFTSNKLKTNRSLRRNLVSKRPHTSKLSMTEALGCNDGLSRPVFMYLDNICHKCFNLFREMEIYYMCR